MHNSNFRKVLMGVVPLSLCLSGGSVVAQDKKWSFDVGLGLEYESAYVGSDEYSTEAEFQLQATYTANNGSEWFVGTDGVGVRFEPLEDTKVILSFEYEFGRDNDDDPILAGFAEVEDTWEFQAIVVHDLGPFRVGAGLQQDILGRGKGLVGFVGAGYEYDVTDRLTFNSQIDFSFANSEHMNTEVGITAAASAASGLSTYDASGGYKGASIDVGFDYALTPSTTLTANLGVETYGSAISDSPLVRDEGSSTTQEASIGIRYSF